ncbi:ArsR family transcriptional regulator [Patescibacteria group bacterium]|nr:ArsR family transcriptional regulator [Patescibacteria group bacterium]
MKTSRQLERHFKGVANHRRIDILLLIDVEGKVNLDTISHKLNCNMKTISQHTRRLVQAGLVNKKYQGQMVFHSLTPYGKKFLTFIKKF